ncbi:MAG: hypothetical protein M5U01_31835 [Ardenticatenaceae bacterium]|nr:hypothetical protein [Ardenticatenaceae bacterium]
MPTSAADQAPSIAGRAPTIGDLAGSRGWLVVAVMLLIVAAPLLRPGLPVTRAGFLPVAYIAGAVLPPALAFGAGEGLLLSAGRLAAPLLGTATVYKLLLAAALAIGAVGMTRVGRQVGGLAGGLLAAALFLFLPLLTAALYLEGRVGWVWAWALWPWVLALAARPRAGGPRLLAALVLASLALALGVAGQVDHLAPAELLMGRWPEGSTVATWLSLRVHQLGQGVLGLGLVSAWLAVAARGSMRRGPLVTLTLAVGLALSALVPRLPGLELRLLLAALLLIRGAAALPALAPDFARAPWLAGTVALVALLGYPHLVPAFHDQVPTGVPRAFFGPDRLALVAATVEGALAPGSTVAVATTWQVTAPLDRDYTGFVHIVGATSLIPVAQQDGLLLDGERPSSQWVVGELVSQHYTIAIPADVSGGPYRVLTGLYRADTGVRLPRWPEGDSVEVAP